MTLLPHRTVYLGILAIGAALMLSGCKPSGDATAQAEPPPPPMRETLPEPHPSVQVIPAKQAPRN